MAKSINAQLPFLVFIAVLYTLQSIFGAITFQGMPAVLREAGVEPVKIGLVYLLMLPWACKFLWAAPVESYRKGNSKATKQVFVFANALAILLLSLMALSDPSVDLVYIFLVLGAVALLSSTVDISLDGYAIGVSKVAQQGWLNVMQIGGGYLGAILGGGVFLILIGQFGWQYALLSMSLILGAMLLFIGYQPLQQEAVDARVKPSLKSALLSPKLQLGMLIIVIVQLGLRLVQGMMMPFFIDRGISLTELGSIAVFGGSVVSLLAVFLSGVLVNKAGARAVLIGLLITQVAIYIFFFFASSQSSLSVFHASVLLLVNSACAAASFVALYTLMMGWTSKQQAGVDFSLLQCTDTAIALLAGMLSGALVQFLDYQNYFLVCVAVSTIALFSLPFFKVAQANKLSEAA